MFDKLLLFINFMIGWYKKSGYLLDGFLFFSVHFYILHCSICTFEGKIKYALPNHSLLHNHILF